jgi:Family of unknown function (DUF6370)
MKSMIVFLCSSFFTITALAQTAETKVSVPDAAKPIQVVEVSCGKCKLGLAGKTCDMAVRIDGKAYYADGANIDSFGDAHAHDGMCNTIRKAEVQGELVKGRYKITYIKLLPEKKADD